MNLEKIYEAKTRMEEMYNYIYDIQESFLKQDKSAMIDASESIKNNAKTLYLSLVRMSILDSNIKNTDKISESIIMLETLIEECSGFTIGDLKKKTRMREIVTARQVHMTMLNVTFGVSTTNAGAYYLKDHATVVHSKKIVRDLYQFDSSFRRKFMSVFDFCIRYDLTKNSTITQDFLKTYKA